MSLRCQADVKLCTGGFIPAVFSELLDILQIVSFIDSTFDKGDTDWQFT